MVGTKEIRMGVDRLVAFLDLWREVIGNGMTEEELCERADIAKGTPSTWRNDKSQPRPPTLRKLAAAIEVPEDDIFRLAGYGSTEVWTDPSSPTPEERVLQKMWRAVPPEDQPYVVAVLRAAWKKRKGLQ